MQGFMDRLADVLGKFANRINNLRYIMVIKNAFAALIPVIITGAFGTLFSAMVFDAENGLAQIEALRFLESLKPISSAVSYVTLSFLTIYAVFLIGIELAKLNKISGVFPGIIAVMSYLSVNPMIFEFLHEDATVVAENVLAKQYTDTKGLFLGMFVAIVSIELYAWLGRQKRMQITMPDHHRHRWFCYQSTHRDVCLRYHLQCRPTTTGRDRPRITRYLVVDVYRTSFLGHRDSWEPDGQTHSRTIVAGSNRCQYGSF